MTHAPELTNLRQRVVARTSVGGMTGQIEENSFDDPATLEMYTRYSDYTVSLVLPNGAVPVYWTRFVKLDGYVRGQILDFDPVDAPRHTRVRRPPCAERTVSYVFDRELFHHCTNLSDWDPARLKACYDIGGPRLLETMQRLLLELLSPGFAHEVMIEGLGRVAMAEIARHFHATPITSNAPQSGLSTKHLGQIRDCLEEWLVGPITVRSLADLCSLSPDHLRHAFRKKTGQSLGRYIEELRIAKAKALLNDQQLSLKQIAHRLGFSTAGNFSVAFRRVTGQTPKGFQMTAGFKNR